MRKKTQTPPPEGFRYQAEILTIEEEQDLVTHIQALPLKEFEFHDSYLLEINFLCNFPFVQQAVRPFFLLNPEPFC